jgi:plastocyanin
MKMNKSIRLTILAVLVITGVVLTVSCGTASPATTATATQAAQVKPTEPGATPGPDYKPVAVAIENYAYSPATLTVTIGTTVTWTNKDSTTHTVVSTSGNVLNSGNIPQGGTFSFTFTQKGTYEYRCGIHPSMTGKVIVE